MIDLTSIDFFFFIINNFVSPNQFSIEQVLRGTTNREIGIVFAILNSRLAVYLKENTERTNSDKKKMFYFWHKKKKIRWYKPLRFTRPIKSDKKIIEYRVNFGRTLILVNKRKWCRIYKPEKKRRLMLVVCTKVEMITKARISPGKRLT